MHARKFGIGKPDAMVEHGAVADETLMIVVVEEILPLREQLGNVPHAMCRSALWIYRNRIARCRACFRHVAVHHAFAGDEPQVALQRFLKQCIERLRIDSQ
jgi:hypothetical protein